MNRQHRIRGVSSELQERALTLRREMTPAEQVLWEALRRGEPGIRFRRQHPVGRTILDFYAPACKLVVELDGPIHRYQREQDEARTRHLEEYGYTVLRFANSEVMNNLAGVLEAIRIAISLCTAARWPSQGRIRCIVNPQSPPPSSGKDSGGGATP